ncbi:MAG: hypothetical protein V3R29_05635, partial [Candidatus Acidoferrales bacterium]
LTSRVVFTVLYQREVDGRTFRLQRWAALEKDANTGKPFLWKRPFSFMPENLGAAENANNSPL